MPSIKQRIRMFAQWATAMDIISSTNDLKSVARPDHRSWVITIENYHGRQVDFLITAVSGSKEYQIKKDAQIFWQGIPTDTNFNLVMRSVLNKI